MHSRNLLDPSTLGGSDDAGSFGDRLVQQVEHRSRQAINNARAIIEDASTSSTLKVPLGGVETAARFVITKIRKKGDHTRMRTIAVGAALAGLSAYLIAQRKFRR